jgi:subtilisin family serine protease
MDKGLKLVVFLLSSLFLIVLIVGLSDAQVLLRKIVIFDPAVNERGRENIVKGVGGIILKDLRLIDGKAVLLPEKAVSALKVIPGVRRVDPDVIVKAFKGPPSREPQPPPPEELPWGVDRIDAELVWDTDGNLVCDEAANTGEGVKVAILDTGIDLDHPDLQDNIAGDVNIINPRKTGDDDNGHGTHVAGTVAAVDNDIGVIGVSPKAYLYAVKVLNRRGFGFLSDVIAGLQWCIDNGMEVVNMSLGADSDVQSFHDAVTAVYDAGIVQVAAAGNEYGGPVAYPAAYPEVIAVSATDSSDNIADFSSVGDEVELAAPGVDVPSTWKDGEYKVLSGTSMAAPHVTGTVALVIAAGITGVDNVRSQLQTTADDLGDTGKDALYGYGLVDAEEAATGTQTSPAPRFPGLSPNGKLSITWGSLKR